MKYIVKNKEPAEFDRWKAQANENWLPSWTALPGFIKGELHESLLQEQGWICCYCCGGIEASTSHIEHFRPQSRFRDEAVSYPNLLASCGREDRPGEPRNCGKLKGNWYDPALTVSPLDPACENRFRFTADGAIYPEQNDDSAEKKTIEKLGLDTSKLKRLREAAIDDTLKDLEELTDDDLRRIIQALLARDAAGKFAEFCVPVTKVLSGFIAA